MPQSMPYLEIMIDSVVLVGWIFVESSEFV